jgi:hypothetical protein
MTTIFSPECRPAQAFSPQERAERLAGCSPERLRESMYFLSGYAPAILDAVLDASEPFTLPCSCGADDDESADVDPFQ